MPSRQHRTNTEIGTELESLERCIQYVMPFSTFGDDNHAALQAQIRVLRENMDQDQLLEVFGEGELYTLSAALDALDWLNKRTDSLVENCIGVLLLA